MKIEVDEESQKLMKGKTNNKNNKNDELYNQKEKIIIKEKLPIRNSSFELLIIILMIFIALSHILFYTKSLPKLDDKNYKTIINNNYIFLRMISNNGKIGDILFSMISGYFSIKKLDFHYYKFILIFS